MAIIYSYPGATPTLSDTVLGTKFEDEGNPTKSFLISDILNLANSLVELKPYKVFTALLTQTGDNNPDNITSGNTVIGVTYQIFFYEEGSGWDFTNVGAPNNDIGTYFIATGTTPNSWGSGVGLLYNTGAPVTTVLENTIGNVWFTYYDTGTYNVNSDGLFTIGKTVNTLHQTGNISDYGDAIYYAYMSIINPNLQQIILLDQGLINNDGYLDNKLIEIRVYN